MSMQRTLSAALGGCKELALFETFALRPYKDLSAKDVERMSGLAWATIHRRLKDWEALGLVRETRKDGKAHLYQLNRNNPTVVALSKAVTVGAAELIQAELLSKGVKRDALEHPDAKVVKVAHWQTVNEAEAHVGWAHLPVQEVRLATVQEDVVHVASA